MTQVSVLMSLGGGGGVFVNFYFLASINFSYLKTHPMDKEAPKPTLHLSPRLFFLKSSFAMVFIMGSNQMFLSANSASASAPSEARRIEWVSFSFVVDVAVMSVAISRDSSLRSLTFQL